MAGVAGGAGACRPGRHRGSPWQQAPHVHLHAAHILAAPAGHLSDLGRQRLCFLRQSAVSVHLHRTAVPRGQLPLQLCTPRSVVPAVHRGQYTWKDMLL